MSSFKNPCLVSNWQALLICFKNLLVRSTISYMAGFKVIFKSMYFQKNNRNKRDIKIPPICSYVLDNKA